MAKDVFCVEARKQGDELRLKLQESFKEYLWMDKNMAVLRREAVKGSAAAEARNVLLQRSLEKLTTDFEVCAKDLTVSQRSSRELEFELETLVRQFNALGDTKKQLDGMYSTTTNILKVTEDDLEHLRLEHDQVLLQKAKFEADTRLAIVNYDTKIKDMEVVIATYKRQRGDSMTLQAEHEEQIRTLRFEVERLNANLKVLIAQRNSLQQELQQVTETSNANIAEKSAKILELRDEKLAETKKNKQLNEVREQLIFQSNDLKASLDATNQTCTNLNAQIEQLSREHEEKLSVLDDQIDKLSTTKLNLTKDKATLNEKLTTMRQEFKTKEDELYDLNEDFNAFKAQTKDQTVLYESSIIESQESLAIVNAQLSKLTSEYTSLEALYTKSTIEWKHLSDSGTEMVATIAKLGSELSDSKTSCQGLERDLASSRALQAVTKSDLDRVRQQVESLSITLEVTKQQAVKSHDLLAKENAKLVSSLALANTEITENRIIVNSSQKKIDSLGYDLVLTKSRLEIETHLRETFEAQVSSVRNHYDTERRLRVDFERMHMKMKYQESVMQAETLKMRRLCDRKLTQVAEKMQSETRRLGKLVGLLPTADANVSYEIPSGKEFEWMLGADALRATPATRGAEAEVAGTRSSAVYTAASVKARRGRQPSLATADVQGSSARQKLDARLEQTQLYRGKK